VAILSNRNTVADFECFNVLYSVTNIPLPLAILRQVVMQNFGGEFSVLIGNE
jgi:hypothetical protein